MSAGTSTNAPPKNPSPSPPPVTYPHLGTLCVAAGLGATTFAAVDTFLPVEVKGALAGLGSSLSAVGLFLLGRST